MSRLAVLLCLAPLAAAARPTLKPLPEDRLRAYAPLLAGSELALLESDATGRSRQITVLAYVPAPPQLVHDVVAHPESFPRFVRNVSKSTVEHRPDGALVNSWRVELPIGHFDGLHELRFAPGPAGPIDVLAVGPGQQGVFRWEFLPADGGGTVVVHMGWHDPLSNNFLLRKMLERNPSYEAAMGLSATLVLVKAVQREAARLAAGASASIAPPRGRAPGFSALLDRGTLAIIRSDTAGALIDISLVERIPVPLDRLLGIIRAPDTWPSFLSSVTHCDVRHRDANGLEYRIGIDGIILDVDTTYRMNFVPGGADALGIEGDLKGSRYRWDLSASGPGATIAVYRGNAHLSESSRILRMMFRHEPSFEHSANVGVGVVAVRAMARRALQLEAQAHKP
jgi:hypothetical protein